MAAMKGAEATLRSKEIRLDPSRPLVASLRAPCQPSPFTATGIRQCNTPKGWQLSSRPRTHMRRSLATWPCASRPRAARPQAGEVLARRGMSMRMDNRIPKRRRCRLPATHSMAVARVAAIPMATAQMPQPRWCAFFVRYLDRAARDGVPAEEFGLIGGLATVQFLGDSAV